MTMTNGQAQLLVRSGRPTVLSVQRHVRFGHKQPSIGWSTTCLICSLEARLQHIWAYLKYWIYQVLIYLLFSFALECNKIDIVERLYSKEGYSWK